MSIFRKSKKVATLPVVPFVATPPKSVESITAKLHDTVAELEAHAEEQRERANLAKLRIVAAQDARDEHNAEHERANAVAGNIKNLLGL